MKKKYVLKGVFTEFGNKEPYKEKKLGKKIKGRKAIPNYFFIDQRIKTFNLPKNYSEVEYNLAYIKELKKTLYSCKQFECGNLSDSSAIIISSVNEDFDEYTMKGNSDIKNYGKITRVNQ